VLVELADGCVERRYLAIRTRKHHAAFHDGEDVGGEGIEVESFGETGTGLLEAFTNCPDPAAEVFGDEPVGRTVLGVDLEGKATQGAAVLAVGSKDAFAIAGEDGENAVEWIAGFAKGGVDHLGPKGFQVFLEDGFEKGFLTFEEMVEAAAVDFGVGEEVGHAGSGEATLPEKEERGVDEALTCFG